MRVTPEAFLAVTEWLPAPMLLLTDDGTLLACNRSAARLLGSAPRPDGASLLDAVAAGRDEVAGFLRRGARTAQPLPGAIALRDEAGASVRHRASLRCVSPAEGDAPALLQLILEPTHGPPTRFKLLTDRIAELGVEIQRRKLAEEARQRLEAQVLQSQKLESLGVLAGGIAHDFNNLLTSVIGYCDLARREVAPGSAGARFLDEAVNGARRAAELTQQMLAYSGKGRFIVEPLVLSDVVQDIARLLEVSISKKCVLRYDLMADQPPCQADATQIRQVIMNLIINASDAIGERSGVISLTTGAAWCDAAYLADNHIPDALPEGLYVHLEVADTGVGMDAATRAKIFDPFFTTKFTGRGLGLAAVLGIVRGHGGAIRVYSEPGRGTTFKLLLPAMPSHAAAVPADPEPVATWQGDGLVLVVDDEESIRAIARHILTTMGFEVLCAADGREAIALFDEHADRNPLVLLDLTMPHLDGGATFRGLRRIRPDVRTILMSGYNAQTVMGQFAGKGLAGFIQKPFRIAELKDAVQRALAGHELTLS